MITHSWATDIPVFHLRFICVTVQDKTRFCFGFCFVKPCCLIANVKFMSVIAAGFGFSLGFAVSLTSAPGFGFDFVGVPSVLLSVTKP